ncbi:MAG: CoA pyrophosphatase [Desulfobacterales bacterium]
MEEMFSNIKKVVKKADRPSLPAGVDYDSTCVFLLLFDNDGELNILTVQKTDNEGYPWRNQVALPGGHVDKDDAGPLEAAYRELEEELKIKKEQVELIGSLGHFQTINRKDLHVFIGIWKTREIVSFDPSEISKVFEIPLKYLIKTHIDSKFNGRIPEVGELLYPFEEVVIWGVTARILHYFLELVYPIIGPIIGPLSGGFSINVKNGHDNV